MKRKNNKFRSYMCNFVSIVLFIVILTCVVYLINYSIYRYNKTEDLDQLKQMQKEMQEEVIKDNSNNKSINNIEEDMQKSDSNIKDKQKILPEYESLSKKYPDMYGRIRIEGIKIKGVDFDYVVMYTPEDPNFYEDKNWEKERCAVGTSVWIDGRTTEETENTIIYGHSMRDLSIFGALRMYKEKEFFEEHKYIQFDTLYERKKYEIIAVSKEMYYDENVELKHEDYLFYDNVELNSKSDYNAYLNNAKKKSYYEIDTSAKYGDELITLCTCDYEKDSNRLIIIAKKI